ncbi:MAG: ABC transporter ATP-binding protein [Oscillospiraceae bacterium]|nr:ABC transporter ATP-binding protein [Oscillospiraceae bacterium]
MMNIIEFKNIYKSYNQNNILEDFNLKIKKGEFITVIGSSGSGKTTVLKIINGLITPDKGDIFINNENIEKLDKTRLRRKIGYVIQGIGLFPHLTVKKNINYVLGLNRKSLKEEDLDILIEKMGLEKEMMDRFPDELSGGQQQRVGIARAVAANPDILLMDEPFGAVDDITRKSLQKEIKIIHKNLGITIFFITHDIREALNLGSKILIMDKGEVHQYDTADNIRESPKTEFVKQLVGIN